MSGTSEIRLIDTHAHLTDRRLVNELDRVLERAALAGVEVVVAPGTTAEDSASAVELARRWPGRVFAGVAIHPNDVSEARAGDWERVVELSREGGVVAIGETGLDRYWDRTPFVDQQASFERHLELAAERSLPIIIHCRDCYPDVTSQLRARGQPIAGVLHSFTGTWTDAEVLLELGLHLSFAGMVTFANRTLDGLREAAQRVPLDRILVETDSPYLAPMPHRGQRNEPAHVRFTAEHIARLRGMSLEELSEATTRNARSLFGLDLV
jgi:TatD DNase family protein